MNHDVEFYPYIERDVVSVVVHPEFYAGTLFNDLAVLRLDKAIDFSQYPHISPACLPEPGSDFSGQRCWTTGWGKDAFGEYGKYQNILKVSFCLQLLLSAGLVLKVCIRDNDCEKIVYIRDKTIACLNALPHILTEY